MLVTDFGCWWQNNYVGDFFRYVGDFLNVLNRSPTSQTCHQHIWSPTSVTNIDITTKEFEEYSVQLVAYFQRRNGYIDVGDG